MGDLPDANISWRTHPIGDVNADGYQDIACFSTGGFAGQGHCTIYSGVDGAKLQQWIGNPYSSSSNLWGTTGSMLGDINGDGHDDFILKDGSVDSSSGIEDVGALYAISGADFSLIYTIEGNVSYGASNSIIVSCPDINGDGHLDFIYGFYDPVTAYSGVDGSVIWQTQYVWGPEYNSKTYLDIDYDGDGYSDYRSTAGSIISSLTGDPIAGIDKVPTG